MRLSTAGNEKIAFPNIYVYANAVLILNILEKDVSEDYEFHGIIQQSLCCEIFYGNMLPAALHVIYQNIIKYENKTKLK